MSVFIKRERGAKLSVNKARSIAHGILKHLELTEKELSIFFTDNSRIKELNKTYRAIDKPTDVLSFPMDEPFLLGDIVISVEMAESQAGKFKWSLDKELARLLIHGILHLLGYEHVKGGRQARNMREKEKEIFKGLEEKGLA